MADCDWMLGLKTCHYLFFWRSHIFPSSAIQMAFLPSFVYLKTQLHILFMKSILTGSQRTICMNSKALCFKPWCSFFFFCVSACCYFTIVLHLFQFFLMLIYSCLDSHLLLFNDWQFFCLSSFAFLYHLFKKSELQFAVCCSSLSQALCQVFFSFANQCLLTFKSSMLHNLKDFNTSILTKKNWIKVTNAMNWSNVSLN